MYELRADVKGRILGGRDGVRTELRGLCLCGGRHECPRLVNYVRYTLRIPARWGTSARAHGRTTRAETHFWSRYSSPSLTSAVSWCRRNSVFSDVVAFLSAVWAVCRRQCMVHGAPFGGQAHLGSQCISALRVLTVSLRGLLLLRGVVLRRTWWSEVNERVDAR